MALKDYVPYAALLLALCSPFLNRWLALHIESKEQYKALINKAISYAAILYVVGSLIYTFASAEAVTKYFIFRVGFHFFTLSVVVTYRLFGRLFDLLWMQSEQISKLGEGQIQAIKNQSDLAEVVSATVDNTRKLTDNTRKLTEATRQIAERKPKS